jgi:uncharacterized membrane protein
MEKSDRAKPYKNKKPRWRRVINGLFFGALCGSVLAVAIVAAYLGPSCYMDDRPATFGGTQRSWAVLISSVWGAVGAILGAGFGALVSLPEELKWRVITAVVILAAVATIMLVINTTWFF